MASWEEASRCPKCGQPGEDVKQSSIRTGRLRGGVNHVLHCKNERCKWFETGWSVSVGPNGEIPENLGGPKQFPDLQADEFARRYLQYAAQDDPIMQRNLRKLEEDLNS